MLALLFPNFFYMPFPCHLVVISMQSAFIWMWAHWLLDFMKPISILVGLFLACVLFGLLTGWWQWWVKFMELFVAVPVGIVIFRVATAKIADFKKDKPPAYLINRLSQRLGLNESGRVQRCGDWDTSRTIEWKEDE